MRIVDYLSKDIHLKKVVATVSLFIVFFIALRVENNEMLLIACYSGMFVTQQSSHRIIIDTSRRIIGTLLAGGTALLFFYLIQKGHLANNSLFLLCIPLIILVCSRLMGGYEKNKAGVMSVCLTTVNMLLIVNPSTEYVYLVERLIATVIGTSLALKTNIFFHYLIKKRGR